ncbi:hypothetical protein [Winogradskyella sp. 3972H.M.0a.05]|uniref:hypothetical protein n=1 Tax=Winogradskyella sp. 3972H.M.0a.05 TaxID=2950277 RepID=UPI00339605D8
MNNKNVELIKFANGLDSLAENLEKDFKRFKTGKGKKYNTDFLFTEWEYLTQAGEILWHVFDNHYSDLDKKLQIIVGDWKSQNKSSYNPNWAKARTFENVCKKWIHNFDWIQKSKGSTLSYSIGMKKISEYLISLNLEHNNL